MADERDLLSAILDTVGAMVAVLDREGRIVRFNRACEQTVGYAFAEVRGSLLRDLFLTEEESQRFQIHVRATDSWRSPVSDYESHLITRDGGQRLISWSATVLPAPQHGVRYVIATGVDITERKRLERAVLDVSNSEQRRIGQDLHDGLGQHLTGIAFMGKALEQKLADQGLTEAFDAAKIVKLVNRASIKHASSPADCSRCLPIRSA